MRSHIKAGHSTIQEEGEGGKEFDCRREEKRAGGNIHEQRRGSTEYKTCKNKLAINVESEHSTTEDIEHEANAT